MGEEFNDSYSGAILIMVFITDVLIHSDMGTCTSIQKQTEIVFVRTWCVLVWVGSGCG